MENTKLSVSQIKYLLAIKTKNSSGASISEIAAYLGVSKPSAYKMVLTLISLGLAEKEFYGEIIITDKGAETAEKYEKKYLQVLDFFVDGLGIGFDTANEDALNFVIYMSPELVSSFIDVISKEIEVVDYNKNVEPDYLGLKDLAEYDGSYEVPFKILRQNERKVSMSNRAFEHPCYVEVTNGSAVVKLKAKNITNRTLAGRLLSGKLSSLSYWNGNEYLSAMSEGDTYIIPIFNSNDSNTMCGKVYDGTLLLKIYTSIGAFHTPEPKARLRLNLASRRKIL